MKNPEIPDHNDKKKQTDRQKPDFETMSGDELEKYLETAAERITANVSKGTDFKIEVFWIQGCCVFLGKNQQTGELLPIPINEIPASILFKHHDLLVQEATRLEKARLMMVALLGRSMFECDDGDFSVSDYSKSNYKSIKHRIADLKNDLNSAGQIALFHWDSHDLEKIIAWLAPRYDEMRNAFPNAFCIGRVSEVEQAIGLLGHRRVMDCPPYAQVLLQGFEGVGIRHPEYHLASDIALLYNLFLDAEQLSTNHSEHRQSLGRSVMLTCFNLLEAFITGLAAAFAYENPQAPRDTIQQLKGIGRDGLYLDLRLDQKFELFPTLIVGKSGWNITQPPFPELFARVKVQRNAMTHPSMPFQPADKPRIQNESRFHDITLDGVREVVDLTSEAICRVWQFVHGKPKPSWLRQRQEDGRFPHVKFKLAPNEGAKE
jgi:hypothetical protein